MTVYIEYAILQNFLLDVVLLWLSCKGTKTPFRQGRWTIACLFGAMFAVVYPLLRLPAFLGTVLKISAGLLLCLLAFGRVKGKKEWGRYALFSTSFFSLSFLFGGALNSIAQGVSISAMRTAVTPLGFLTLSIFCSYLLKKLYKKRTVWQYVYECEIASGDKSAQARGFFDSGNTATKKGIPVCFVSPEIIFNLWGDTMLLQGEEVGQVCDEMCISTVSGEKKIRLYKGSLTIKEKPIRRIKEVYFAPSVNILSKEYTMLLHSRIFDKGEEV